MDTPMYVIVTFVNEDDTPGIVLSTWIHADSNICYYPNVRTDEMKTKLLKKKVAPEDTWPQYNIKVLKRYGMSSISLYYYRNLLILLLQKLTTRHDFI